MLRDHCDYTRPGAEPWWQNAAEGEPGHATSRPSGPPPR